ncbi:E3 ubiquitin-protein ligase TRIM71-like [Anneissia japonica]|uniref:E3 ubiquitin-protein ligase TRIM71-like n=1 Tax=Anneissia japonica TaxID=1529436 RepID=UPI00142562CA|nr:E3 ubiquitin-protein ligase TRIM71-like [Anneissia japonica]XP_033120361.1 E3 ubiquitin-protein ligase TRIM71-like [Anneissia japonica]XP_033120362.1 E3 ubiquitin-protein ligase TRIM71-like [Anneissia japonica]
MAEKGIPEFLDNLEKNVLECAICLKRLNRPKTLVCLHTFCLSCLQDWVKQKDGLICPTCYQPCTIPEGGLQKLPPNTFLINLLENVEQFEEENKIKCLCSKAYAKFYCQNCRNHLCCSCKDQHELFPQLRDHQIHSVEDVKSITSRDLSSLNTPLCSLHKDNALNYYCNVCVTPICTNCTITEHSEHKHVDISDAFNEFVESTVHLKQDVEEFKATMITRRENAQLKAIKLEESNEKCKNDINAFVEEMKNLINEMEANLLKELHNVYGRMKKRNICEIDDLNRMASDVDTRWNYISQLLKNNKATALQSSERAVVALQDKIKVFQEVELRDEAEIHFLKENKSYSELKQNGIGCIVENDFKMNLDSLTVTRGQTFMIKISKISDKYASKVNATLTHDDEITIPKTEHQRNGDCVISGTCSCVGVWNLNVGLGEIPIKGSPLNISVENIGLRCKHDLKEYVTGVVMTNDELLLVANKSNEILKLEESVESRINLPKGAKVHRINTLKTNGNIVFSDTGNRCITICKLDGQVIRSIGEGLIGNPYGIDVNERTNELYVADYTNNCIFVFSLESYQLIKKIGSKGKCNGIVEKPSDVTLTKDGHVVVADTLNHRIQMFDREGSFIQVLVQEGFENGKVKYPRGVVMDEEEHLIVASNHKLQLFEKSGKFIKIIGQQQDGINNPEGVCVVSYYPRRVAVANWNKKNVLIFNY